MKKTLYLCVANDITQPILTVLRDFASAITVKPSNRFHDFMISFREEQDALLVIEHKLGQECNFSSVQELKARFPKMRVMLVMSGNTPREEAIMVIQSKVASAIIMRPFTLEQVSDNVYKLLGIQKPQDTPWYMATQRV